MDFIPRMEVLGVPVSVVDMESAVKAILAFARHKGSHTVFVRDTPSLVLAAEDPALLALHHQASLVVPDGFPLVWVGRRRGETAIGRVAGTDLVDAVCNASLKTGQTHFFYGGKPGVAEEMARRLTGRYPGLKVAGTFSPPMRDIAGGYDFDAKGKKELATIRRLGPDFVWVGLSSPKQEWWMSKAAPLIGRGVFLGVGAAFDFHSGAVRRAPPWMRNNGLEWLHRLLNDPKRLWRRYLVLGPRFVWRVLSKRLRQ
jgi:N-acetylglucosaminyldiphosphoundecaprenol N-acetyl-beta-D-mannosaminyltransferase